MPNASANAMKTYIGRIATGPELSKDLSLEEARDGMQLILEDRVDPVQAAIFLIALRMKRETDDENRGVLEALRAATHAAVADVDELVDIADPYNGFERHLPPSPFLPALLAACGMPAVSHGLASVGPKYGVTHRQILTAAGALVDLTSTQAATRIANPAIGWAYVDQSASCPALHRLVPLRELMVKRPCLSTLEKITGPVRARGHTHLVIGYVHKAYQPLLATLARHAGYTSAMVIRGIEGGTTPALRSATLCSGYRADGREFSVTLEPGEIGITSDQRTIPVPAELAQKIKVSAPHALDELATITANAGLAALHGTPGLTYDSLVCAAAAILWNQGRFETSANAADHVRQILDSGQALARFRA